MLGVLLGAIVSIILFIIAIRVALYVLGYICAAIYGVFLMVQQLPSMPGRIRLALRRMQRGSAGFAKRWLSVRPRQGYR